jgi:hypothetical protein
MKDYEALLAEAGFPVREVGPEEWDPTDWGSDMGDTRLMADLPEGLPDKHIGSRFSGGDWRSRAAACRAIFMALVDLKLVKAT